MKTNREVTAITSKNIFHEKSVFQRAIVRHTNIPYTALVIICNCYNNKIRSLCHTLAKALQSI